MSRCPRCAELVPAGARFCLHCGAELGHPAAVVPGAGGETQSSSRVLILIGSLIAAAGAGLICCGIGAAVVVPLAQQAREARRQEQARNNLRQLGEALHAYSAKQSRLPPANGDDEAAPAPGDVAEESQPTETPE